MGVPQTTFEELLEGWERVRFFGRIFDEALHLRIGSVRCVERGGTAALLFCCGETPVKSMTLPSSEARALLEWLLARQPSDHRGKIFHGAPTGYFSAQLRNPGAGPEEIFRFESPSHADVSEAAAAVGIDIEGVRGLEGALEKFPGVIVLAGPNPSRLMKNLELLTFFFGWVNGGIAKEGAGPVLGAAAVKIPLFIGILAGSIAEALADVGKLGIGITELPLRGFLFDEGDKISWHPPLGPTVAALRAKALAVRSKNGSGNKPGKRPGKPAILVVEDDLDQQQILQLMLHSDGYEVLTAANGVDALEVLRENKVDGVVTDLLMPVLDGKQLLLGIRRDPKFKSLPVMVLTVIDDEARERELLQLGANDYCGKTSPPKSILDRVRKLVRNP